MWSEAPLLVKVASRSTTEVICVRDVLSAAECEALIARAEAVGFEPATINTHSGAKREVSLLTFMIYLNEGYRVGATAFHNSADIIGERGMAVLFEHGLAHQGAEVTHGVRNALRSDIMYGPVGRIAG